MESKGTTELLTSKVCAGGRDYVNFLSSILLSVVSVQVLMAY